MALLSRSEYGTLQVRIKARLDEASAFDCDGWWFDGRSIINKPYDREVAGLLGLADNERVIGFVHVGTVREAASEHPRPALAEVLGEWSA